MIGFLFSSLFNILIGVLSLISIVFVGYSFLTVAKEWNKGDNQKLFNLLVISGGVLIIVRLLDLIVKKLTNRDMLFRPLGSIFLILIVIIVPLCIYLLTKSAEDKIYEYRYFDKLKDVEFVKKEVMTAFSLFMAEIEKVSEKFSKNGESENYKYSQEAKDFHGLLKERRSLILFVILNVITCGFYKLYFVHTSARDTNIACAGDGGHTSGLIKYIILTLLTCGLYSIYWDYALADRLAANGPRYGFYIQENGSSFLLWSLLGGWLCGLGYFVARNITLKNLNKICRGYNQKNPIN